MRPTDSSRSFSESPDVVGEPKPSPMSGAAARAESRSVTCFRKRATTKPTAATGTVQRKTVWRVSA
ncbi:hypothetical protein STANM309S_04187 [Streptomyces tanashiensis]